MSRIKEKLRENKNVQKAFRYFSEKGLPPHLTAGVVGNLMQESYLHLDSTIENEIGAVGIAQWLGVRRKNLENFAKKQGKDFKDFDVQLDFLWHELNTTGDSWNRTKDKEAFFSAKTAEEAAKIFVSKFERSGEKAGEPGFENRLKYASSVYDHFGQKKSSESYVGDERALATTKKDNTYVATHDLQNLELAEQNNKLLNKINSWQEQQDKKDQMAQAQANLLKKKKQKDFLTDLIKQSGSQFVERAQRPSHLQQEVPEYQDGGEVKRFSQKEAYKRELSENPNQLPGESDEQYAERSEYFKQKIDSKKSTLDNLWESVKERQEQLPWLLKAGSEIVTSPIDVAYYLSNKLDIPDTEKYKSDKQLREGNIQAVDSATDALALLFPFTKATTGFNLSKVGTSVPPSILHQATSKAGKEVLTEAGFDVAEDISDKYRDGGEVDPPKGKKKKKGSLDSFLFDTRNPERGKFLNPMDILGGNTLEKYEALDSRFGEIHLEANKSCLAGSMNCSQEYIAGNSDLPGLRTIIANSGADPSKYKLAEYNKDAKDYVPNQSIDAWEVHDFLQGEGLGYSLFKKDENTKYGKGILPEGFDYTQIPLGAVIGQGNSAGKYTNPKDGERSRHAMVVVGFDEKDGMPMVYDFGKLTRLDKPNILKFAKVNNITVPNEYKGYTRDKIKTMVEEEKAGLGISKTPVQYEYEGDHYRAIEKGVNAVKDKIAYNYGVPGETIDTFAKYLPGLSYKETKINNNEGVSESKFVDNGIGNAMLKEMGKDFYDGVDTITNWFKDEESEKYKQDWELEVEAYEKYGDDVESRNKYFNQLKAYRNKNIKKPVKFSDNKNPSVGAFAVKDIPKYAEKVLGIKKKDLYGASVSNEEELEKGSQVALAFLAENYAKLGKKYPDLSEEELVDLTLISYNNKSKTEDPVFIEHYIKNRTMKDVYLEDIKGFDPNNLE